MARSKDSRIQQFSECNYLIPCDTLCIHRFRRRNMPLHAARDRRLVRQNLRVAKQLYPELSRIQLSVLHDLTVMLCLSVCRSQLVLLGGRWYVRHSGLLLIAHRRRCFGIDTAVDPHMSEASAGRSLKRRFANPSPGASLVTEMRIHLMFPLSFMVLRCALLRLVQ